MSKLFSLEGDIEDYGYVDAQSTPESQLEEDSKNVEELVNEYSNDLSMVTEGFKTASGELKLVTDMKCSLESKKLSSADYFTSVENYSLTMKHIADNLGVKLKVPSLEDFKNPHGTKASHAIAIEGFGDFVKKIWEKIKDFFSTFFKKIAIFFKRLVNADLDLKTYEEYVDDLIRSLKKKDATLKDSSKLGSKLPSLLADEGMNSIDNNYILNLGIKKIDSLSRASNELFSMLPKATSMIGSVIRDTQVDRLNETKTRLEGIFTVLFQNHFELNDLPDITYDKVMSAFSEEFSEKSSSLILQSFVNTRNKHEVLPKCFNMYLILEPSKKLMLFASSEKNTYTENTLEPISSLNNIAMLFDDYKKFSKSTNISKFSSIVAKSQDEIDDVIKDASRAFTDLLKSIRNSINYKSDISRKEIDQREGTTDAIYPSLQDEKAVEDVQQYILNVLYSLQVLLREISTNLAGTIMEVRFELIKYLYNSCRRY